MKRIKYLHSLQKQQRQKSFQLPSSLSSKSAYLKSMKQQALQTLYNTKKEIFQKNQLNITMRHSQRALNQYESRSQHKANLRKTFVSLQTAPITKNSNRSKFIQSPSVNVQKLLRIKTESQVGQQQKLKNPFYKIQKPRDLSQILTKTQENQEIKNKQINKNKQRNKQELFIARNKKQWYFASKKYRLRTVHHDQVKQDSRGNCLHQEQKSHGDEYLANFIKKKATERIKEKSLHKRQMSLINQFSSDKILQFSKYDSLMTKDAQNIIIEVSRQESPVKIRQKSLTVKYNQIKDYFEKKYLKNSENLQCYPQNNVTET